MENTSVSHGMERRTLLIGGITFLIANENSITSISPSSGNPEFQEAWIVIHRMDLLTYTIAGPSAGHWR